MIRKLMNTIVDTTLQPLETIHPTTLTETTPFEWLRSVTPCFPISSKNITILTKPSQFYNKILEGCTTAQRRITLVSLYLGSSKLEQTLIEAIQKNVSKRLQINVLLDYTRASRLNGGSSRTMLLPLLENDNCKVSLYHTPALRGVFKKIVPQRWNELWGLQHMKLYIFDDTLIISGANLSKDYFTNRQDRYFVIKDKDLSDFYCGLTERVQTFSLTMDRNNKVQLNDGWDVSPYEGSRSEFVKKARGSVVDYLNKVKDYRNKFNKREDCDTWIFPTIQMGQININQDTLITNKILSEIPASSQLNISTGYFNLTKEYCRTLLEDCQGSCHILMAHPKANGFLGVKGVAGGIPYAYSLIAQQFKKAIINNKQENRIKLYEYLKDGWTFHGKGLWYYPPGDDLPCLTMIGSPNFGERSAQKDLETQIVIITNNVNLKNYLHRECMNLFEYALPAEVDRSVPLWVRAFVACCRNYF